MPEEIDHHNQIVAHLCIRGNKDGSPRIEPFPRVLCSVCRDPSEGVDISFKDLVSKANANTDTEKKRLAAVKWFLSQEGDDLCYLNRNTLAAAFGLEKPINPAVLDPLVMIGNCVKYCQSLHAGKDYVNPDTGKIHYHPDSQWEYREETGPEDGSGLEQLITSSGWDIVKESGKILAKKEWVVGGKHFLKGG